MVVTVRQVGKVLLKRLLVHTAGHRTIPAVVSRFTFDGIRPPGRCTLSGNAMDRRQLLQSFLAAPAARPPAADAARKRPNILFLMTDEHRSDCVGYENPVLHTPNLDRLAAESVVFTRAYSTSPSCVPARAAIYTGRYPSQCGAPSYITYLPRAETTFMSRLQDAGYYTAAIGKQHFGDTDVRRGYDYEDLVDFENDASGPTSYTRHLAAAGLQPKQLRKPAGRFANAWQADQRYHIDDFVGEQARRWLRDRCPRDKPWFLTVSFHGPHQPFDGLGLPYEKLYSGKTIDLPQTTAADMAGKPPHFGDLARRSTGLSGDEIRNIRRAYYSKISQIDAKIGGILDTLKARGEYDNTLIVFTADHGDYMGHFGMVFKGQYLSEALMRIPMLAKPPIAGYQGRRETAFVQNFDIAPTCLAAAGLPVPPSLSARDLSPFWKGSASPRTHCFLDGHTLQGIRDDRWKLVHYRDRPYGELYDLQADPWERKNLWDDASRSDIKSALHAKLLDHLIATGRRAEAEWNTGAPEI
jgi:arylsulfatase